MATVARRFTIVSAAALLVLGLLIGLFRPAMARAQTPAPVAGAFRAVTTPARLLDTRRHQGGSRVAAHGSLNLLVLGRGAVPASHVTAVMLSVVVTQATASGYLTAFAYGSARPKTSNINFRAGVTVSNQVTVRAGSDGRVSLYNGSGGTVEVVADVYGYVSGPSSVGAGSFVATSPARLLDTRSAPGTASPGANGTVNVAVAGHGGVPTAGVGAVALSITAVGPSANGSIDVYPTGGQAAPEPTISFDARVTTAGATVAPVGTGGGITLANESTGTTALLVDVVGYFAAGAAGPAGMYVPVPPTDLRLRADGVAGHEDATVDLVTGGIVPDRLTMAVLLSVTVTAKSAGYLTPASGSFDQQPPGTSALTLDPGSTASGLLIGRPDADVVTSTALWNGANSMVGLHVAVLGYFVASPGGGAVTGRVTDSSTGAGLAGVEVDLHATSVDIDDEFDTIYGTARTGTDGSYTIAGASTGYYILCFDATNVTDGPPHTVYERECWQNVPYRSEDRSVVHVTVGSTTTGIDAALASQPGGSISGSVTGAGDAPLAGVGVSSAGVTGSTDTEGHYRLDGIPAGSHTVRGTPGLVVGPGAPYGYLTNETGEVTVTAGADTSGVNVHLAAQGRIVGHIRTSTGAHLPAGWVTLFGPDGKSEGIDYDYDTYDGSYTVTGIAGGTYTVCYVIEPDPAAPPYGWADTCYDGVGWPLWSSPPPDATTVTVAAGAQRSVDATIEPAGAIAGTVRATSGGAGVDNVEVVVYDRATHERVTGANTDIDGDYIIQRALPPSTTGYLVCANGAPANRKSVCYDNVPVTGPGLPSGTTPVTVSSGALHSGVDFVLPPA